MATREPGETRAFVLAPVGGMGSPGARNRQSAPYARSSGAHRFCLRLPSFVLAGLAEGSWRFGVRSAAEDLLRPWLSAGSKLGIPLLFGAVFTLLGYSERLYHPETVRGPQHERLILGKVFVWSTALLTMVAYSGAGSIDFSTLVVGAPLNFLVLFGWREGRRRVSAPGTRRRSEMRNVLIVGAGPLGRKLADVLEHDCLRRHIVKGFLDETAPLGGEIHGRLEDLARVARRQFIDEIILAIPTESPWTWRVVWEARRNRIDVKIVPDLLGFDPSAAVLERFDDVPVLTLCEERIPAFGLLWKRMMDLVLSAAGLIATLPLLAAIAIAIKIDSRGPVLYRAPRLGLKGRRFLCCKFRTMHTNADQLKEKLRAQNQREGPFFKLADDPRVTQVGRFLRRYSLDELPQLWNVLVGEMSLVGPRPHPVDDFERYDLEDWQRLEVLPGITGLWQVTARRDPSFERA